jgi:DNA-binding transcriptional ArsR family regulator
MESRKLDNRKQILEELGKGDLRFEELLKKVSVSRATLNSHLKQLVDEGKIKKAYSSTKNAIVYTVLPEALMREVIIHDFVNFVGSSVIVQILQKEMGEIKEIDMRKAFPYGTVEDFVERRYKTKPPSYREILDILKEEYGDWIETMSKEGFP